MKELKILAVLVLFTGAMYWGIEPYAHSIFHPEVKPADFTFSDVSNKAERDRVIKLIDSGDRENGKEQFSNNCAACHSLKADDLVMMDEASFIAANELLPPDLSNATALYDEAFLFEFIKNPGYAGFTASHTAHQKELMLDAKESGVDGAKAQVSYDKAVEGFDNKIAETFIKMPGYEWLGDEGIADILAYLRTTATDIASIDSKEVTINACARCHSISYDNVPVYGELDKISKYLGATPPDLSVIIFSHGESYLNTFINDPQKHLLGTGMPKVGLNEAAQAKVIEYLDRVGDPKKDERSTLGMWFIIYFIVVSILAYAWKKNEFEEIGK